MLPPFIWKLAGWTIAAMVVVYAFAMVAMFIPLALAGWLYVRHVRGWKIKNAWRAAVHQHDGMALAAFAVIAAFAVVTTLAIDAIPVDFASLRGGQSALFYAFKLTIDFLVIAAACLTFHIIAKGQIMKDIFAVIDNLDQFDAFAENNDAPLIIEIDPPVLKQKLKNIVIGQDDIVDECVDTLARRIRLQRKNKPLGVFMFVGASGAGKTELAKALADTAFEGRLCRYDMNQFTEAHSTQSLIGSPPGYVGSEKGGQLTQDIKRMRSGVILLDEIEKAHSDVFKLIMGLLDEGRIQEQSSGKTMDATKFIIVMTSNAEHEKLAEIAAKVSDVDERRRATKDTLQTIFKPEQLARIDEVFCFKKLDKRAQARVIGKFLFSFAADIGVELAKVDTDLLIDLITRFEKQSDYGIRALISLIEKQVTDGMLEAKDEGFSHVALEFSGDRVSVRGIAASEVQA